ncbi:MAG: hypothetical protein JXA13_14290 [Anaerolineales bacterium]|nr:hypothetical protein [Anaerolineales bacterium]
MKAYLKNAATAGIIFGIITTFLFLINFIGTAADLIGDITKSRPGSSILGLSAVMFNQLIFLGLIGIWAGARGSRKDSRLEDTWKHVLIGGALAGAVHGLIAGSLAFLVGSLNTAGVKINEYLSQILPEVIRIFLLNKTPLQGALFYLVFMTLMGMLGGLFGRGVLRSTWRKNIGARRKELWNSLTHHEKVLKIRANPLTRYVVYGLLLLFVFLMPLQIGQYWNYTVGTIGIYVLLGLGLNIVVGMAGLLDLGYVAFFAIGAYSVALLTAPTPHNLQWSFWLVLPIGIILASLTGILLGIPVLRMRGDYLAIVTLGFGEIIRILSKSVLLTPFSGGPKGVFNVGAPTLFGKPFNSDVNFVWLITLGCLLVIFVTNRLQNSRVGRAWEAMREDETVAQAMGINTLTHKLMAFAIGAAFAGLGGILFASRNQFTGPEDHSLMVSINVLSLVIVGGMGSIPGVIAGAFVLKGLPEILRQLENYRVLFFGVLLVVMMVIRPEGLIPGSRQKLELQHTDKSQAPPDTADASEGSSPS